MSHSRARAGASGNGTQFLDPKVLARISNLELLARTVVDGFLNGLHRAPHLGVSMDFAEHRAYSPGDDIRHLDWKLLARTDRYYVKQFEAETNANLVALLDVSASMNYRSDPEGVTKLDYGRFLAASLLHFSRKQRDRVGLLTFDSDVVDYVPPSARNLDLALHTLARIDAGNPGLLRPSMMTAADRLGRRGVVAVISDLYEDVDEVVGSIRLLLGRGHDIVVFHILDLAEVEFPFDAKTAFEDIETGEQLPVVPDKLRDAYLTQMQEHRSGLEKKFSGDRVDYVPVTTDQPLDLALFRYLTIREKKARRR